MGRSGAIINIEDSCDCNIVVLWNGKVDQDLVVPCYCSINSRLLDTCITKHTWYTSAPCSFDYMIEVL